MFPELCKILICAAKSVWQLTDIQRFTEQYATLFSAKLNKIKSHVFLKICQNIGIIAQLKLCGLIGVDSGDTSYTKYTINNLHS